MQKDIIVHDGVNDSRC